MNVVRPLAFACLIFGTALAGCGGNVTGPTVPGPTTTGGGPLASPNPGASSVPGSVASGAPSPTVSAPPNAPGAMPAPSAPPDAAGHASPMPAQPSPGASRTGLVYDRYITAPTGDTVAFTVFEPATLTAGKTYPLILQGHGFGGSRVTNLMTAESLGNVGNIAQFVANGYGVISLDERGFGETTGLIRSMDPDFEGKDDLAILDWAQTKLPWLAYGPTLDGGDPAEPIVGSTGGSYGGMYQLMLLDIDPRHRLRAIVPQFAPNQLNYSLYPNGAAKTEWGTVLEGTGQSGGNGFNRAHEDPFLIQAFQDGVTTGTSTQADTDFFDYHSNAYFCNGSPIATNGGPGTMPLVRPNTPPKINALFFQGMRDTLFNFNEGYANYTCLQRGGGDVRLLTYQFGHNSAGIVPDMGAQYQPANNANNTACGKLESDVATLAFFNRYLKNVAGAADVVPTTPCLSLSAGDAVLLPSITTGHAGTQVAIPATRVVAGASLDVPTVVDLNLPAPATGTVVGGIPRLEVDVEPAVGPTVGVPVLYFGIGQMRASNPGTWDLVDNLLTPTRGTGMKSYDMSGISQRLAPGDRLALLIYGLQDQFAGTATGAPAALQPSILPVTVSGNVWVPLLGPLPASI